MNDPNIGTRYGKLTIIRFHDTTWSPRYICRCDCGNEKVECLRNLRRTKRTHFSCGNCPKSDEEYKELILSYVKYINDSGCWVYKGHLDRDGYGSINIDNQRMKAHRAAYLILVGEIPTGFFVCHRCDNPSCINPAHLFVGTHSDNERDKDLKGRRLVTQLGKVSNLSKADVRAILREYKSLTGIELDKYKTLAERYSCTMRTVERIVKRQFFKTVDEVPRPPITHSRKSL